MTGAAPWTPLFDAAQARPYLAVIDEIAEKLLSPLPAWAPRDLRGDDASGGPSFRDASLAGGLSGLAIFYAYLHLVRPQDGHDETAYRHLHKAMDLVEQMPMPPSLYGGFTGIAWTATHLQELLDDHAESGEEDDDDPAEDIDELLADFLSKPTMPGNYDVVSGLVGQGVYALERMPRPQAAICLERVIDRLAEISERHSDGITWLTPPAILPPHQLKEAPEGYYNLGVAHGIPGIIALLGAACSAGVTRDKARELLDGAVSWLLAHRLPGGDSAFTYWLDPDPAKDGPRSSRCAWCYGDPGIAATLFFAARCVDRRDWEQEALSVALAAAAKPFAESGVTDAGLCHGAVGLAHIYNRFWQATGREEMARAARFWYEQTLAVRRPGEEIVGFPAFRPIEDADEVWVPDAGFLTGVAGIALAFLAGVSHVTPQWDRILLVSLPPRS